MANNQTIRFKSPNLYLPSTDSYAYYWPFNETSGTVADDATNNSDGTIVGSPTMQAGAPTNGGFTFNGSNQYVSVGTLGSTVSTLPDSTLEFWVKTTATRQECIMGAVNTGTATYLFINTNNGPASTAASVGSGRTMVCLRSEAGATTALSAFFGLPYDGKWHFVQIVFPPGTSTTAALCKVSVDGRLVYVTSHAGTYGTMTNYGFPMYVGARNLRGVADQYFTGGIASVAWTNRALNDAELRERFQEAAGRKFNERNRNWSWWSRPRAIAHAGKLYLATAWDDDWGFDVVDSDGMITEYTTGDKAGVYDDHNNGAILIAANKPPLMFYTSHNTDAIIRVRRGSTNIENGFTVGTKTELTSAANTSYVCAHSVGNEVWVFYRSGTTTWKYRYSSDWGVTWAAEGAFCSSAETVQMYMASVVRGTTLRVAMSHHPINSAGTQSIYYVEVNLTTGAITKSDGTAVGTLGTNFAFNTGELIFTAQVGYNQWIFDVGDGVNPEIAFMEFDNDFVDTTGVYKYAVKSGGSWTINNVVSSGKRFNAGIGVATDTEPYFGAIQIARGTTGGIVHTVRHDSGDGLWKIERHTTTNNGTSWQTTLIHSQAGSTSGAATLVNSLARAWPIEGDGSTPYDIAAFDIAMWRTYAYYSSKILLLQEPAA